MISYKLKIKKEEDSNLCKNSNLIEEVVHWLLQSSLIIIVLDYSKDIVENGGEDGGEDIEEIGGENINSVHSYYSFVLYGISVYGF